jgi:hypothetical protein
MSQLASPAERSAPIGTANQVEALVIARGVPFPNLPNNVGQEFASSAGDNTGLFGVGVNGFFFTNSLPPDALLASGEYSQTITNNSTVSVSIFADVTIPAPTIQFFGVGDFFPIGVDPRRDVAAFAKCQHPDHDHACRREHGRKHTFGLRHFSVPRVGEWQAVRH